MPTTLTPSEMKQFVLNHFEDFVNNRKAEVIHRNMTPDFYDHDGPGGKPAGIEANEKMMRKMYEMMPDLHISVEEMVAEGDKVVCRNIWRWTDPASQKKMQFHGFVEWRFEGTKIAERWATVTPPSDAQAWTEHVAGRSGMKVVLYGASGRAGSRILQELVSRGHKVVAISRDAGSGPQDQGVSSAVDDLSDVTHTAEVIQGADAVISAYAPPAENQGELVSVTKRFVEAVGKSSVPRFLMVGGAGSLEVAPGVMLFASGKLPPEWLGIAQAHADALEVLSQSKVDWTSLSPAGFFDPGERTGKFRLGKDELIVDAEGNSRISMEDYAIALVDELEQPKHRRERFSVGY